METLFVIIGIGILIIQFKIFNQKKYRSLLPFFFTAILIFEVKYNIDRLASIGTILAQLLFVITLWLVMFNGKITLKKELQNSL